MRRRDFITLVGGSAAWPLAAYAQQPLPLIGFVHVGSAKALGHLVTGFRQGLKETGYIEGQNVAIELRWADGQTSRLPELVADLLRRHVAVLVTGGGEAPVFAAKAATSTIPIVFSMGNDPVQAGVVASFSRPGGNATGVNLLTAELEAKRLGLLHQMAPKVAIVAHLVDPRYAPTEANIQNVAAAAREMGLKVVVIKASGETDINAALTTATEKQAGALLVGADPYFNSRRDQIVALVQRYAIPAIFEQREFCEAGGLMSYGTSITDAYRQLGVYAGKILKGEKPADLPVVQPDKFTLIINLKTAKSLGLTVPQGLLNAADDVIE